MTDAPKLKAKLYILAGSHRNVEIPIDGYAIKVRIAVLTGPPLTALLSQFDQLQRPHSMLKISGRLREDEYARTPAGAYIVPDEEIHRRRFAEMTLEQLQEYERIRDAEEAAARAFIVDLTTAHLSIAPGQISEDDPETGESREITTGADLARLYSARRDVLSTLLLAIVSAQAPAYVKNDPAPARPKRARTRKAKA